MVFSRFSFVCALSLACSNQPVPEAPPQPPAPAAEVKPTPVAKPMAHDMAKMNEEMEKLPVEKRVAFMSGHVAAGLALVRAGAPDQAAKHLLHPVSETHAAERAGIDELGFNAAAFEEVSKALEAGRPATEIEPMLAAAEANISMLQKNAGGDPADIIIFLMETVDEEYAIGVNAGVITDPGEYQDAYGFTVVALEIAKRMTSPEAPKIQEHLQALLALWPEQGPLADSTPAAVGKVKNQAELVQKMLNPEFVKDTKLSPEKGPEK